MNIPKAIQILNLNLKLANKKMPPDVKDALELAIEALEQILAIRQAHPEFKTFELLSETED